MMEALSNRHGQMDIHLDHVSLRLPLSQRTIEVNGTVSVSIHLRDLSEKEPERARREAGALAVDLGALRARGPR